MRVEELIDQLEQTIRDARETPLIGGARIKIADLTFLLNEIFVELTRLSTPLDEERYVRRAAGVRAPMDELQEAIDAAARRGRVTIRVDRERLLPLVHRMRQGTRREEIITREELERAYDPAPALALVEELEHLVGSAPKVPLVDEVRINKEAIYDVIDRMRATLPEVAWAAQEPVKTRLVEVLPVLDLLDDEIHDARPVPLTDQVRLNRGKLSDILRRIRAAFSQGTLAALTN